MPGQRGARRGRAAGPSLKHTPLPSRVLRCPRVRPAALAHTSLFQGREAKGVAFTIVPPKFNCIYTNPIFLPLIKPCSVKSWDPI